MNKQANWVVLGRFGRAHGVKGFVVVHSFTEPRATILEYTNWHVSFNKKWQAIQVLAFEVHNKTIIAQIEGFAERELANQLTNAEIVIEQSQLAVLNPGDYYWHQLIGLSVVNQDHAVLGKVVEIMATGANDVLIVSGEQRHLIPYLPGQFIKNIDLDRQKITIDWDLDF